MVMSGKPGALSLFTTNQREWVGPHISVCVISTGAIWPSHTTELINYVFRIAVTLNMTMHPFGPFLQARSHVYITL